MPSSCLGRMLARAELELRRVHRRELGRLFTGAALLLLAARAREDGTLVGALRLPRVGTGAGCGVSPASGSLPLRAPAVPLSGEFVNRLEWENACRGALALLERRDAGQSLVRLLVGMLERPMEAWMSPVFLAALGARLAPGCEARLAQAQVLCAAGRHRAAQEHLGRLFDQELDREESWRALYLLGCCHLAAGRSLFALGAFEAASELPACAVGALVEALALARLIGDEGRCRRAAARLDLVVAPEDPEFRFALEGLGLRMRADGVAWSSVGPGAPGANSPAECVLALIASHPGSRTR